jgi:hypothetical protein
MPRVPASWPPPVAPIVPSKTWMSKLPRIAAFGLVVASPILPITACIRRTPSISAIVVSTVFADGAETY